jgi:hypothetical protein
MKRRELSSIDYTAAVFFKERFPQENYDSDIDRGMSSGLRRYLTLDVTALDETDLIGVLENLLVAASDFNVCKIVEVKGFNKGQKRYVTVDGEGLAQWHNTNKETMLENALTITAGMAVTYLREHIMPKPEDAPEYVSENRQGCSP